jgi:hypothetical protein
MILFCTHRLLTLRGETRMTGGFSGNPPVFWLTGFLIGGDPSPVG